MTLKLIHLDSAKKILTEDFKTFSANPSASNWRVLEASMLRYQQEHTENVEALNRVAYANMRAADLPSSHQV
jgi:hypothetical protein